MTKDEIILGRKTKIVELKTDVSEFTNQKQWKKYLQSLMQYPTMLKASILIIYKNQTQDEKDSRGTLHKNGVGFNQVDAAYLTTLAKELKDGKPFTMTDYKKASNKMKKYWKQLMVEAKIKLNREMLDEEAIKDMELRSKQQSDSSEAFIQASDLLVDWDEFFGHFLDKK